MGQKDVEVKVHRRAADGTPGELIGSASTNSFGDFAVRAPSSVRGDLVVVFTKKNFAILTHHVHVDDDDGPPFLAETMQGDLIVAGRVLDAATEKPIPDAEVTLHALENQWRAVTDGEGRFSIKGVPPASGVVAASATRFGRERRKLSSLENAGEVILRLKPERSVRLQVTDPQNQVIAGVAIELLDEPRSDLRTGVTDQDGGVLFAGLHFDANRLKLRLSHPDFVGDAGLDREVSFTGSDLEMKSILTMSRAATIVGRVVVSGADKPLAGARVITGVEMTAESPRDWTTDTGRFEIRGIAPGPVVITVHHSDYSPELRVLDARAGEKADVEIGLQRTGGLRGTVKDRNGEPVEEALVETGRWRGFQTLDLRTMTGSDGGFILHNAPGDAFVVRASAPGAGQTEVLYDAAVGDRLDIMLPGARGDVDAGFGPGVKVGDASPALRLTTLTGETITWAEMRGKVVLLDFWATWCVPCVLELPHLLAVYDRHGARKDFAMIGISIDDDETALRDFVKQRKIRWPQIFGEAGGSKAAVEAYGVNGIPMTFLIDRDGKVVAIDMTGEDVVDRVGRTLGKTASP